VELKAAELKQQIGPTAQISFALGNAQIAITEEIVRIRSSFYLEQLSLDDKSLERRSVNPKKAEQCEK